MLGRQASRRRRHRLTPVIHCVCAELSVQNSRRGPDVYISYNWADTHFRGRNEISEGVLVARKRGLAILGPPLSALLKLGQRPPAALGQGEHDPKNRCPT
jgi:hypothetical protein